MGKFSLLLCFALVVAGCGKKEEAWPSAPSAEKSGVLADGQDRAQRFVSINLRTLKFKKQAADGMAICDAGGLFTNAGFQLVTSVTVELQIKDSAGSNILLKAIEFSDFRDQVLGFGPALLPKSAAMKVQEIELPTEVLSRMASYWFVVTKFEGYGGDSNLHDPLRLISAAKTNAPTVLEELKKDPRLAASREPTSGVSLVHIAFITGDPKLIDYFASNGNYLKEKTKTGLMPVHCAGLAPTNYGLKVLKQRGIPVDSRDAKGKTPLMLACEFGTTKNIEDLIEFGAKPNVRSNDGFSPFFFSTFDRRPTNHLEVVKALKKGGFDANEWSTPNDHPLHIAWDPEVITYLVSIGGNVNAYARGSAAGHWTPLHQAAKYGRPDQIAALLENGADPRIKTVPNGNTPADIARNYGRLTEERLIRSAKSKRN
ncbi:MAG: ankyrin repeat domain-containing protein [Fimbriimonadaceae bacterium]|nr:ankyrin repeat domain-containing protein [Fimbriimonadaceae bacterium]